MHLFDAEAGASPFKKRNTIFSFEWGISSTNLHILLIFLPKINKY
jgi:hypothetical protein